MTKSPMRCGWCEGDPLYERYHDEEWGRPVDDDHTMFEFLTLESAQAGLSWITILRRRGGNASDKRRNCRTPAAVRGTAAHSRRRRGSLPGCG